MPKTMEWCILREGQMWPNLAVVGSVGLEDPAQMALTQNHDVVQALPADRADQSLRMPILCQGDRGVIG